MVWRCKGELLGDPLYRDAVPPDGTTKVEWVETKTMVADPAHHFSTPTGLVEDSRPNFCTLIEKGPQPGSPNTAASGAPASQESERNPHCRRSVRRQHSRRTGAMRPFCSKLCLSHPAMAMSLSGLSLRMLEGTGHTQLYTGRPCTNLQFHIHYLSSGLDSFRISPRGPVTVKG